MKVPVLAELFAEGKQPEVLFWVGCAGSFDQRAQKITKAFVTILDKVGINYAILGKEKCVMAIRCVEPVMNLCFK
jgi:Fe-S oxidoreductase